ncbi:MAG: sialate O-acetylesterase [Prevotella sp.]|nr:sialate O-acetylesterase [Prevotella sp.]
MKQVIILLLTVMGTFQLQAQDQNFWIFLCFGQSNMAGQAPIEEQDLNVSDRYLSMATTDGADRKLGTWRKAVPPLCRADAHLGPADWFGRTLIDMVPDNVRIGIVSVAVEGCPITFFDKDQNAPLIAKEERDWMNGILNQYGRDPYKRLLSMAKIAAKDGVIKGILLHQGETDAYNDQWRKTLRKIYRDLQQELKFDSTAVPLLVGEVVRGEYGGICGHANPTINDIANHYPNTYVVSSEGCMPSDDNLHFSSEGYRLLGRHYALRYLEATNPALAEACRSKLAAAGLDKTSDVASKLSVKTRRNGMILNVSASDSVEKVDVVSFSGKTVKAFMLDGKKAFDISLQDLPKEKLVIVFHSAIGKATVDVDLTN